MKKLENKAEYLPLSELVKLENNPRTIKKADFEKLKESIKSNPDYFEARPIICSDRTGKNVILGGNQRYEAAKALGLVEVPVIVLEGLDKEEMLEEFEDNRQMLESHEEVLVFTNADSLKELQASFPEIGGKNA